MLQSKPFPLALGEAPQILAQGLNLAPVRLKQSGKNGQQRGFTAARWSHHQVDLPAVQIEGNIVQGGGRSWALAKGTGEMEPAEGQPGSDGVHEHAAFSSLRTLSLVQQDGRFH